MLDVFAALKTGVLGSQTRVTIDNVGFQLHYRVTFLLLLAFTLVVTSRQYIGDPIDCMTSSTNIPVHLLDNYCWISTTFSVPSAYYKRVGLDVPYQGVDKSAPDEARVHHQYYQWVCFVLFLQAIMFYIPRFAWKAWEGGLLKSLSSDINSATLIHVPANERSSRKDSLISYFNSSLHSHNFYFWKFIFCVLLNFLNVIGQIYFTNRFLGGQFTSYGIEVIKLSEMDHSLRNDPMQKVFPRVAKCTFRTFGSSGDVQIHDALCVLPINVINEKIYIFLWFWFVILAIISGLDLVYRIFLLIFPRFRLLVFRRIGNLIAYVNTLDDFICRIGIGDWFVLYQLGKNVSHSFYFEVITELANKSSKKGGSMK